MSNHPKVEQLHAYLDQSLEAAQRAELEAHLSGCSSCANDLVRLRSLFTIIEGIPDEPLARNLAPAVLAALSPLPRWVPRLAIGELVGALAIITALVLGLGTSEVLVGVSASAARLAGQVEAAGSRIGRIWEAGVEWSRSLPTWDGSLWVGPASGGIWATIAIGALILWFLGNGLVLGQVRRKVRS